MKRATLEKIEKILTLTSPEPRWVCLLVPATGGDTNGGLEDLAGAVKCTRNGVAMWLVHAADKQAIRNHIEGLNHLMVSGVPPRVAHDAKVTLGGITTTLADFLQGVVAAVTAAELSELPGFECYSAELREEIDKGAEQEKLEARRRNLAN